MVFSGEKLTLNKYSFLAVVEILEKILCRKFVNQKHDNHRINFNLWKEILSYAHY